MAEARRSDGPVRAPPLTDRLFLAVLLDEATAAALAALAVEQQAAHGLRGTPLAKERFHVTLQFFGDFPAVPAALLAALASVAQALAVTAFDVAFDRVASFPGRGPRKPLVLRGSDAQLAGLFGLYRAIDDGLRHVGVAQAERRPYTPHITLMYGDKMVAEHAIPPLRFTVREFVLVDSHIGQSHHEVLRRWPLR